MNDMVFKEGVFVYVLARSSKGFLTKPVKVGIAKNPHQRAREINTSSPFKVVVAHTFSTPDRDCAGLLEATFHEAMKSRRLHGEWFKMEAEEAIIAMAENYHAFLSKQLGMNAADAAKIVFGMLVAK